MMECMAQLCSNSLASFMHYEDPDREIEQGLRYIEGLHALIAELGQEMNERALLLRTLMKRKNLTVEQAVRLLSSLGAKGDEK